MTHLIYDWIDILWLPIAYFSVHKEHRWWSVGLVLCCMVMMRLQVEIMQGIGYDQGLMGLMDARVQTRGLTVYSIFYILFFLMAHFSKRTEGVVFMAACLAIFFMAMFTSMIVMIL